MRGRSRPGPRLQNGFRLIEVSLLTSFRVYVYGPADGRSFALLTSTTSRSSGSFVEVAWKNGIVIFDRKLPSGRVRLMINLLPRTLTPRTSVPLPLLTSSAPTMSVPFSSVMNCAPGDASSLFATRSIAYLKFFAVTGVPSLNRKPLRMKNVYRLPPFETMYLDATSGWRIVPGGPFLSG